MKALALLKHLLKGYSIHKKDIKEAIEELEELQINVAIGLQDRSCDSCDYYNHNCQYCTNADADIPEEYFDRCPDDFYCKEYEPIKDKE